MRNRFLNLMVLLCLLMLPSLVWGQDPTAAATGGKIGVINIQQAIASTGEGKQALSQIDTKYAPRRDKLQKEQQEITALQDQLQKQSATLSDEERARLTRELDEKNRLFKRDQEDAQTDFQADNQEAVNRIGQKMVKVINEYAQQNGFLLVMDDAQLPIYYVAKGIDITDPIVKLYDQANPMPAGSASKPAAPAASKSPAKPKP